MPKFQNVIQLLIAFCLIGYANGTARAIDLTGTWEGQQVCQYFDGREFVVVGEDELQVSQTGNDLFFSSVLVGGAIFHAQIIQNDRHPSTMAQAIFIECDTTESSTYQELGRATKLQTSGAKGLFEARSNFFQIDPDERFMGSCNWTYRRVNTSDPSIGSCSAASLRVPKAGRSKPGRR